MSGSDMADCSATFHFRSNHHNTELSVVGRGRIGPDDDPEIRACGTNAHVVHKFVRDIGVGSSGIASVRILCNGPAATVYPGRLFEKLGLGSIQEPVKVSHISFETFDFRGTSKAEFRSVALSNVQELELLDCEHYPSIFKPFMSGGNTQLTRLDVKETNNNEPLREKSAYNTVKFLQSFTTLKNLRIVVCQNWSPDVGAMLAKHEELSQCCLSFGGLSVPSSSLRSLERQNEALQCLTIRCPGYGKALRHGRPTTEFFDTVSDMATQIARFPSLVELGLMFASNRFDVDESHIIATEVLNAVQAAHGNLANATPLRVTRVRLIAREVVCRSFSAEAGRMARSSSFDRRHCFQV
jgi:hypothetical protein